MIQTDALCLAHYTYSLNDKSDKLLFVYRLFRSNKYIKTYDMRCDKEVDVKYYEITLIGPTYN